jgi:inner membrane protein
VLPFVAWALWAWFKRRGGRVAEAPARWFWVIFVTLMSHPLLDAFTVYGTQLFWPLPMRPLMWSSLFIIDPLFLLPWLAAFVVAWFARERIGRHALAAGIAVGVGYLGWSWIAKTLVDREAGRALAAMGLKDAPRFSVPMPLNTLLWRVVAMTPNGYVEGFRSVVADEAPVVFRGYASNTQALAEARDIRAVRELAWFNHGFMQARVVDRELVLSDLRMGSEPDYFFSYAVARRESAAWQPIMPPRKRDPHRDFGPTWQATWQRIWHEPPTDATPL